MENTYVNDDKKVNNSKEKKIIIILIILSIILGYISIFFIHDIIDMEQKNNNESITDSENNNLDNNGNDKDKTEDSNLDLNTGIDNNNGYVDTNKETGIDKEENNQIDKDNNKEENNQIDKDNDKEENQPDKDANKEDNQTDNETNKDNNEDDVIVENTNRFIVLQEDENWSSLKQLDIFNNEYFNKKAIIAPGIKGKYNFTVENNLDTAMQYNIKYTEENPYAINMVYKVKLNGSYIAGNEQIWVKYEELSKEGFTLNAKTSDIFTIEWKWQDNYNDTQIGKTQGANYKLNINVDASSIID